MMASEGGGGAGLFLSVMLYLAEGSLTHEVGGISSMMSKNFFQ